MNTSISRWESASAVLTNLHLYASRGMLDEYIKCFLHGSQFVGTDAEEYWTIEEFEVFCRKHFEEGKGWTYHLHDRKIYFSGGGACAWFFERLFNEKYGEVRGSGVLLPKENGTWGIAQYVLSFPIPNKLVASLTEQINKRK